jgi:hypothetical protein
MNIIKFSLAIFLFICLLDMPYGYFQLVRYAALIGFLLLAFDSYQSGNEKRAIVYVCLAVLFQPFLKIALGRAIWNLVDVITGVWLLLSLDNLRGLLKK